MKVSPARTLIVGGAALVLGIGGGVAIADIPSSDNGTITACMTKPGGTIRLIDAEVGATCKKGETKVEWNAQGQPGANGVSGYEIVREQGDDVIQVSTNAIGREALCPEGKVPLGGGGAAGAITDQASSNGLTNVQRSLPTGSQDGWSVLFGKRDGTNWAIGERIQWFVQVTCIAALP
jgi:hypothetical protein